MKVLMLLTLMGFGNAYAVNCGGDCNRPMECHTATTYASGAAPIATCQRAGTQQIVNGQCQCVSTAPNCCPAGTMPKENFLKTGRTKR